VNQTSRKTDIIGAASTVAITIFTVAMVYARNNRFFFRDDVEHQHIGVFTALHKNGYGIDALGGFRHSWFLSLITGEVQFGVFNPVSRLRDYIAASGDDLARQAMLIALLYLLIASLGSYVAARALRLSPSLAVAAAAFCTFNVHLLYWDAGSWTPALIGFSWFTWFVAALWWTRRNIRFAVFIPIAGYLLVSAGWPHAMIAAGVVAVGVGLEQLITKQWKLIDALTYTTACVATALLTAPVWLTTKVFADWAARAPRGLFNDGFLTHQLDSLVLSFSPFVQPYIDGFSAQGFMFEPITYIAWFLPLFAYWFITTSSVRKAVRGDLAIAVIVSIGMLGPSILGPTRWPFRFQPFAAFLVVMVALRGLQSASNISDNPSRFINVWKWIAPIIWLATTALRPRLIPMLLTAALFVAIPMAHALFLKRGLRVLAPIMVFSVVLTTGYLVMSSPSPAMPGDRNSPSSRSVIKNQYKVLAGHRVVALQSNLAGAMTVERKRGRFRLVPNDPNAVTAADMADGNIILSTNLDTEFVTGYSAMPPRALESELGITVNEGSSVFGWATDKTAPALFSTEPTTGKKLYEIMGVTAIMVQHGDQQTWFNSANDGVWTATHNQPKWTLYTRGLTKRPDITYTASTSTGTQVVLARPVTPGMQITVGGQTASFTTVAGALPLVSIPAGMAGDPVVTYLLPNAGLIVFLVIIGLLALIAVAILSRRPRHTQ